MACASGAGMRASSLPSAGISPVRLMSTPVTRNAPTAAGQPPSTVPAPTSSAAPGVDQASVTGTFECQDSQSTPMPKRMVSASRPDAAWAGLAPTARSPARTTAKEDVKPTSAVTMPAMIGWERRREAVGSAPGSTAAEGLGISGRLPAGARMAESGAGSGFLNAKGAGAASRRDPRPLDVLGQSPGQILLTEPGQPAEPAEPG